MRHRGMLFAPAVLPFGSGLAPIIFQSDNTRAVVRFVCACGQKVLNFYAERERGGSAAHERWLLPASGRKLNAKRRFEPLGVREFLGFVIGSKAYTLRATSERLERALDLLKRVHARREKGTRTSARTARAERAIGSDALSSCGPAICNARWV